MPRLLFCMTLMMSLSALLTLIPSQSLASRLPPETAMKKVAETQTQAIKHLGQTKQTASTTAPNTATSTTASTTTATTPQTAVLQKIADAKTHDTKPSPASVSTQTEVTESMDTTAQAASTTQAAQKSVTKENIDFSLYTAAPVHAIAMHGAPQYGSDFTHFKYANPDAPKGGTLRQHVVGSYDSLNPFIAKGIPAAGIGLIYQTLTEHGEDEAFTEYGSIAKTIEVPADRSWIAFNLNPAARWHDGKPLTAADVVWTFNTLVEKGAPFYRAYYANVKHVIAVTPHRVLFIFDGTKNLELPLIIGQLPVLPKHYWQDKDFEKTTLVPPLGSGPYKVGRVDQGRSIQYIRDQDWWAKDLPLNKGRYNFDNLSFDYYRDSTIALEGLFAGEYDFRNENTAKIWATGYDNNVVKSKKIIKTRILNKRPAGMQGYFMNTRRAVFKDRAVRQAVNLAFDFEWANKQFAFGAYTRTDSYFENSELASFGVPTGRELEILKQFERQLSPQIFTIPFTASRTKGDGKSRQNLRQATKILDQAGYKTGKDGIRVHEKTGTRLELEIVDNQPAFERWTLPLIKNLKKNRHQSQFPRY